MSDEKIVKTEFRATVKSLHMLKVGLTDDAPLRRAAKVVRADTGKEELIVLSAAVEKIAMNDDQFPTMRDRIRVVGHISSTMTRVKGDEVKVVNYVYATELTNTTRRLATA